MLNYFTFLLLLSLSFQLDKISLLSTKGEISFSKMKDHSLELSTFQSNVQYLFSKSIISITLEVTSDISPSKKPQPVRIYSKLNAIPQPESFLYEKKDDYGLYHEDTETYVYNFEYSPCEIKKTDVINIKIVGIEGKSEYVLNVNLLNADEYSVICPTGNSKEILKEFSNFADTEKGIAVFGGKIQGKILNDLYFLNEKAEWTSVNYNSTNVPGGRYGMGMASFENGRYILIYGGKGADEKYFNDMWVYNVQENKWTKIFDEKIDNFASKRIPKNKFLSSTLYDQRYDQFIIFGGVNKDDNIYTLDATVLKDFLVNKDKDLLNNLFKTFAVEGLKSRYGSSLIPIGENKLMIFGGNENTNNYPVNDCDIIDLDSFVLEKISMTNGPTPRAYQGMKSYGSIIILYGGKDANGNDLDDLWKYDVIGKTWIKVEGDSIFSNTSSNVSYFTKSEMFITRNYLDKYNNERPLVLTEKQRDIILLDIPVCQSDSDIISNKLCFPCDLGYEFISGKCEKCYPGKYFSYELGQSYTKAHCASCPEGTYNPFYGQYSIFSCQACPYGTFNDMKGQIQCKKCVDDNLCLIGTTQPIISEIPSYDIVADSYLVADNYPEFIDQNSKMKFLSITFGSITVFALTTLVIIIILICYKAKKESTIRFLACIDFLPLTGGKDKKSNGGLITIIYSILISSLAISFILRYVLWNDIVEITTIEENSSASGIGELQSSYEIDIEVYGENIPCQSKPTEYEFSECSPQIAFAKNDNYTDLSSKMFKCKKVKNQCIIRFQCENCNRFATKDSLNININNKETYVSFYQWSFKNYWSEDFNVANVTKGHSILNGIFKPNENILSNRYVFKGKSSASKINLILSPIFYTIKNNNQHLSGYRVSLSSYDKGEIRNEYSIGGKSEGVIIGIEFAFSQSRNMVTVKKDISLLDFFAFILGMLAGFSFLSRVSKYIFESCGWLNYTDGKYVEFHEEIVDNKKNIEMGNNNA